jgi:hypothetical protein
VSYRGPKQTNAIYIRLGQGMIRRALKLVLILGAWVLLIAPPSGYAQDVLQVKAAFVFNFAKFVEWPPNAFPDANAPIIWPP